VVTVESAMRVAVAYRCTHIIAGACGNLPIDVYRRSENPRAVARTTRCAPSCSARTAGRPASEFRKMLTAHAVLKGNGYALKITSRGR
jgi:phage portal protein BeeE